MNGENTNLSENKNIKNPNKPQIDPFWVVASYNEQFINQYKAFKLGQERFTEFAKKEREIIETEGISSLQSLQAKVMFFRARELAINYLNRLDEVEAKLEFTKTVLELTKNKKCKIVDSMLIIDEIITDENNNAGKSISIDIDEINQLINDTDLNNLRESASKSNLSTNPTKNADDGQNFDPTTILNNKTQYKVKQTSTGGFVDDAERLKINNFTKELEEIINDHNDDSQNESLINSHSSVMTTKKMVDAKTQDGEGFDEIASKILKSLEKDNSSEHETSKINTNQDFEDAEEKTNAEEPSDEYRDNETYKEKSKTQPEDDYPLEKSETSFGDVDKIDGSELEIVKVYKCNNDCIDLLDPANAELIYGLYSEDLFNETFNKLLDVIYCYPLSIVTLPDVAIDELKTNETTVSINGINQTITTFEYLARFCACVIMRNQKSTNFKQMVNEFYSWCKKVGI